jgi:hypothetical protein
VIELAIFASTFLSVFALGLQSLNVNQGHYLAAALTSVLISTGHVALYKYMPEAQLEQLAAYYTGAIAGILSSMWFHRRFKDWWTRWRGARRLRKALRRGPPQGIPTPQPRPGSRLGVPRRGKPWPPPPRIHDADSVLRGAMRCAYWQCPYEARERSNFCGSHLGVLPTDTH